MAIAIKQTPIISEAAHDSSQGSSSGNMTGFLTAFFNPVKKSEILFFCSQLALMLDIETPLNVALKAIGDQTRNIGFRDIIQDMLQDVEQGRQLSEAMKPHERVFDSVFTSMIRAGESGGFLHEMIERIVELQEKRQALVTRLKSALTYPLVLCAIAFLVVVFILIVVLPKFTVFFSGKESILPFSTRFLMATSNSLSSYWWIYLTSGIGMIVVLKIFLKSAAGRKASDWILLTLPLVGRLSAKIYTSQLLRTLGYLMQSHVPLMDALKVTRGTIGNIYFRQFIDRIVDHVQEGGRFAKLFATFPYLLESVKQMVAIGEETGNLPKVMLRLADFYDDEVDQELKVLSSVIEPIALIFLGAVVGLIVSSVILPMFKLAGAVH